MRLVYNGFLNKQTVENIMWMSEEYPYFLEVSSDFPNGAFSEWSKNHLPLYPSLHEDCMGRSELSQSHHYCLVTKNNDVKNGRFLGFPNEKDRNAVKEAFGTFVLNPDPFKIEF